jgi:hypothetical protein
MIRCTKFTPMEKGALRGFCDLALDSGMIIHDALLMESNGKRWVNLPGKPQLTKDQQVKRGDDGKIAYTPVLSIPDRARRDAFNLQALAAIDAFRGTSRSAAA